MWYLTECFNGQGYGENCVILISSGVISDDDKQAAVDEHNKVRRQLALGNEERGNPGPQPSAANMREFVSISLNMEFT